MGTNNLLALLLIKDGTEKKKTRLSNSRCCFPHQHQKSGILHIRKAKKGCDGCRLGRPEGLEMFQATNNLTLKQC